MRKILMLAAVALAIQVRQMLAAAAAILVEMQGNLQQVGSLSTAEVAKPIPPILPQQAVSRFNV